MATGYTPWTEDLPAPPLSYRFLFGKTSDLNDISSTAPEAQPTVWRIFNDEEDERLQAAWFPINEELRAQALDKRNPPSKPANSTDSTKDNLDQTIGNPDIACPPNHVAVGTDALFNVDLFTLELYPVFWQGGSIPVTIASWFYADAPGRYLAVEPALADSLEAAYHHVRPWVPSFTDELKSAVALGSEAENKLRIALDDPLNIDVIFQGYDSARLYSRGVGARFSKSILTTIWSGTGRHGGGTLVLRGYDSLVRSWETKLPIPKATGSSASSRSASPSKGHRQNKSSLELSRSNSRTDSEASVETPTVSTVNSTSSRLAALLRPKTVISSITDSIEVATKRDQAPPETAKATEDQMEMDDTVQVEGQPGETKTELKDLVLVIHGIGQRLAEKYESFNFVHAVNQLRTNATKHCQDPAFHDLLKDGRCQFLPIRWRANLNLEAGNLDREGDQADEGLNNQFTVEDIEPSGIPFIRQIISATLIDIPHYLSHHRTRLIEAVILEANRVVRLFCQRNPDFEKNGGRISIIAHSLGSLLATDILSAQPTWVPPIAEQSEADLLSKERFCFNTRCAFYVGSPVSFFYYLNGAQVIARSNRERTKNVPSDVALDRSRWGCQAIDSLYNIYYPNDAVAYSMNACCDSRAAKRMKPIAITSQTSSLLDGIGQSFSRVSSLWAWPTAIPFTGSAAIKPESPEEEAALKDATPRRPKPQRMSTLEQMGAEEYKSLKRAEQRFQALNPQGNLDFYLADESYSAIYSAIMSHGNYWQDMRFSAFIVTQLLSSAEALDESKKKLKEASGDVIHEEQIEVNTAAPEAQMDEDIPGVD